MTTFAFDLETIPDQRPGAQEAARERVKVPKTMSKPETIAKHIEAQADAAYRETSLDGAYGEIICCCYAIDDSEVQTIWRPLIDDKPDWDNDERNALCRINDVLAEQNEHALNFVGFNVGWDLEFLWKRFIIHGIRPAVHLPWRAAPWQNKYTDLMYLWAGTDKKKAPKQKVLCDILGIDHADDIDGSEVWDRVKAGDIASVVAHCEADVDRVRQIFGRIR